MAVHAWPKLPPDEEFNLTPSDRKVVDEILKQVTAAAKIGRELSISLIGRSNGETIDPNGGRIGWLEQEMRTMVKWRNWLMTSILAAACGGLVYFIKEYLERHP